MTFDELGQKLNIELYSEDKLLLKDALQADEDRIGLYNDDLLICVDDIFDFFAEQLDGFVERLLTTFNAHKMCAVYYYSVPDLFGYSYFENGQRIRTNYGEMEDIWVNIGDELELEKREDLKYDLDNLLVQQVTGEKLTVLAGKDIEMTRFKTKE